MFRAAKAAIRDELAMRRKAGLPILVWQDGKVVDINKPRRGSRKRRAGTARGRGR
jgi:hypothetical protein